VDIAHRGTPGSVAKARAHRSDVRFANVKETMLLRSYLVERFAEGR